MKNLKFSCFLYYLTAYRTPHSDLKNLEEKEKPTGQKSIQPTVINKKSIQLFSNKPYSSLIIPSEERASDYKSNSSTSSRHCLKSKKLQETGIPSKWSFLSDLYNYVLKSPHAIHGTISILDFTSCNSFQNNFLPIAVFMPYTTDKKKFFFWDREKVWQWMACSDIW